MATTNKKKKKEVRPGVRTWKHTGRGSFTATINGKYCIIKPNQEFKALEEEVPAAFRDIIKCIDKVVEGPTIDSIDGRDVSKDDNKGESE